MHVMIVSITPFTSPRNSAWLNCGPLVYLIWFLVFLCFHPIIGFDVGFGTCKCIVCKVSF